MAKVPALQARKQHIGEININAGTNTVYQQKAQNLQGLNNAFQDITDPIAESLLGSQAQEDRLKKFDEQKDLPIELIPENEGGFNPGSLTKWGQWYDKSYNELDSQLVSYKAQEALTENALELTKPENQGPGITAAYQEKAGQIIKAYANSAEPANRVKLQTQLMAKAREKEFGVAQTESAFNRAQTKSAIDQALIADNDELKMAGLLDDESKIIELSKKLQNNIHSQVNLNLMTHAEGQAALKGIESEARKNLIIGKGIRAETEGRGAEFLAELVKNPGDLTVRESYGAAEELLKLRSFQRRATQEAQANQYATAAYGISTDEIQSEDELLKFDLLDLPQQLSLRSELNQNRAKQQKQSYDLYSAQKEIANGTAASLSKDKVNNLYDSALAQTEQMLGGHVTIDERRDIILGTGNSVPASGIRGMSLGTNVSSFDRTLTAALLSKDPQQIALASANYNYMTNTVNQPNTVKLEGDALAVATITSNLLNSGVDPIQAATLANDTVVNVTEPMREERLAVFKNAETQKRIGPLYKQTFGVEANQNDGSYTQFTNILRGFYARTGDLDASQQATANIMRHYGPSKYYPPGEVMNFVPEKELPIKQVGYAFDNQWAWSIQKAIDANHLQIKSEGKNQLSSRIEWDVPGFKIDLNGKTAEQMVIEPFLKENENAGIFFSAKKPRLKITPVNGQPYYTDVYLRTSTETALGGQGRPIYDLVIHDASGNLEYLSSAKNQTRGNAVFRPAELKDWSPDIYDKKNLERFKSAYQSVLNAPIKSVIENNIHDFLTGKSKSLRQIVQEIQKIRHGQEANPDSTEELYQDIERLYNETQL